MITITGTLKKQGGATYTGPVRFERYPTKDVSFVGASTISGAPTEVNVVNGALSTTLEQGVYTVAMDDTVPWRINVPPGSGSANIETLYLDTGAGVPVRTYTSYERSFFFDTFKRPDTEPGADIGVPDLSVDGAAWELGGEAGPSWPLFDPSEDVHLLNGEVRTTIGKTLYLARDWVHKPREVGMRVKWHDGNDDESANYTSYAISLTSNTSGPYVTNFIHCQISRREMTIQAGPTVSTLRTHASRVFDASLDETLEIGKEYIVTFRLEGAVATLNVGDRTIQCEVGQVAEFHGSRGYVEIYSPNATSNDDAAILATWCANGDSIPLDVSGYTPKPTTPRAVEFWFPGGTARATAATSGIIGDMNASDYSLYFRGTSPIDNRSMAAGGGLIAINGRSDGANWAQGPTLRLLTNFGGGEGAWSLEHVMQEGANTRTAKWTNMIQGTRVAGRQFDVMVTRSMDLAETRCYWDGEFWPKNGEADIEAGSTPPDWDHSFASDDYIHIGQAGTGSSLGWYGGVQVAAVANCVLDDYDLSMMRRGVIPERRKWASGSADTTGSLVIGKTYRIGALGTPDYYYTGCAVGDEFHVLSASKVNLIMRGGLRYHDPKTLLTTTITVGNYVRRTGFIAWWDADTRNPNLLVDLSSNRIHAAFTGAIAPSTPELFTVPYEMADQGDADVTLSQTGYPDVIVPFETTLTGNKSITLPTAGAFKGQVITVIRNAATPGAYTLAVGSLKTIPSATNAVVKVRWSGSAWKLSGYQTL